MDTKKMDRKMRDRLEMIEVLESSRNRTPEIELRIAQLKDSVRFDRVRYSSK